MCAFIFHFVYRSSVAFKFESKELDFIKIFCKNIKPFPYFPLAMGLNPAAMPNWPK
jgi:hypothetical protein